MKSLLSSRWSGPASPPAEPRSAAPHGSVSESEAGLLASEPPQPTEKASMRFRTRSDAPNVPGVTDEITIVRVFDHSSAVMSVRKLRPVVGSVNPPSASSTQVFELAGTSISQRETAASLGISLATLKVASPWMLRKVFTGCCEKGAGAVE